MFKIGDVVVYSATGVCEIEDISIKAFSGVKSSYYVLKPLMQKASTVFVPVDNERLTRKIHPILSQEQFSEVFRSVKNRTPNRPESENERREKFTEILESGNRESLMLMVYDLNNFKKTQQENGRRLHLADERLLTSAENILYEELAFVFKIELNSVSDFLEKTFA